MNDRGRGQIYGVGIRWHRQQIRIRTDLLVPIRHNKRPMCRGEGGGRTKRPKKGERLILGEGVGLMSHDLLAFLAIMQLLWVGRTGPLCWD